MGERTLLPGYYDAGSSGGYIRSQHRLLLAGGQLTGYGMSSGEEAAEASKETLGLGRLEWQAEVEWQIRPEEGTNEKGQTVPEDVAKSENGAMPEDVAKSENGAMPEDVAKSENEAMPEDVAKSENEAMPEGGTKSDLSFRSFIHNCEFYQLYNKQLSKNAQNIRNPDSLFGIIKVTKQKPTKKKREDSLCLILPQILIP